MSCSQLKIQTIQKKIKKDKIKMNKLAAQAGYARPYLSTIINGSRPANPEILNHLLKVLEIDFDQQEKLIHKLEMTFKKIKRKVLYNFLEEAELQFSKLQEVLKKETTPIRYEEKLKDQVALYKYLFYQEESQEEFSFSQLASLYTMIQNINKNPQMVIKITKGMPVEKNQEEMWASYFIIRPWLIIKTDSIFKPKESWIEVSIFYKKRKIITILLKQTFYKHVYCIVLKILNKPIKSIHAY